MQIEVCQHSVSEPDVSIGLAEHRGTHYRFIVSNSDGKVVRLEVWGGDKWIIEAARPPLSLRILIRERLGPPALPQRLLTARERPPEI